MEGALLLVGEGLLTRVDRTAYEGVEIRSDGMAMESAGTRTAFEGDAGACAPVDSIGYAMTERVLIR